MANKTKSARTETIPNHTGKVYRIGDKMLLRRINSSSKGKVTEITSILPSGKSFKVKGWEEPFGIYWLLERGSTPYNGYYLIYIA